MQEEATKAYLDTGAFTTLLSHELYYKCAPPEITLTKYSTTVLDASGRPVNILGRVLTLVDTANGKILRNNVGFPKK